MRDEELYGAMWKRRSVRKYLEKNVEEEKINTLRTHISSLNETSGLTMEFIEESDALRSLWAFMFKNARSVIAAKGRTDDPDLYEKCGYYGEQAVLKATALGLGTCWVAGFNRKSTSLNAKDNETIVCVISVGYGRDGMSGSAEIPSVPHRRTRSISEFLEGNTDVPDWVTEAMKAVQFAPTARNTQKARFRYSDGSISVSMPPGKLNMIDLGITKFHFELAADGKFPPGSPSEFVKN
jgi:nitroreductase